MYHAHHDEMTQMGMGLIGMLVIHPRNPASEYRVDRDFAIILSEWSIKAGTARGFQYSREFVNSFFG
jgi:FtsP/CotA-like multicopper oxidase with cupredoxin domain